MFVSRSSETRTAEVTTQAVLLAPAMRTPWKTTAAHFDHHGLARPVEPGRDLESHEEVYDDTRQNDQRVTRPAQDSLLQTRSVVSL